MNILDVLQQLQDGEPKQVAGNDLDFMMPEQKFQKPGLKTEEEMIQFHKGRGEIGPPPIELPPRWEDIPNDLATAQQMLQRDQYTSHARTAHDAPYDTQVASDQSQRYNNFVKRFGAENLPERFLIDNQTHENFGDPDNLQYTGRPGKPRYPSDKDYRMLDQLGDTNYGDPREEFAKRFGTNRFDYEQRNAPPSRSKKAPQRRKASDEEELDTIQNGMGRVSK